MKNAGDIINTTYYHQGRFGNHFFVAMALHFLAIKNDLFCGYKYFNMFKELGIDLYIGESTYQNTTELKDDNVMEMIKSKNLPKQNIILSSMHDAPRFYGQIPEFAKYLREHFLQSDNKNTIISRNKFSDRYDCNNDLFVHVRADDLTHIVRASSPYEYYDKAISKIAFDKGYISSDEITNPTCQKLIKKYKLEVINKTEVETIMFGSTCKHIVLSAGTFSWMIGIFGYFSNVYYPKIKKPWHGDIFVFDDWTEIDY